MEKQENVFSFGALSRIVIMGVLVFLGWKALSVLPIILIALVLTAAFYPIIKKVHVKTKMPLILCILLILIIPIIPFVILGFVFIPRIIAQIPILLDSINNIISNSSFISSFLKDFNFINYLQTHFDYATATVNITLVIFSIVTTIILTFFLVFDLERLSSLFLSAVPTKEKGGLKELLGEIGQVTGKYIRGNILISVICGAIIYIGLTLLHIPFALPLAIFAALLDLLPLVGQTIGSIPAIIIGFGISPITGILVIVLHLIYQQVENNIISPMIYNKALNLYPSVILLSVLLGASLFGILGAFLSLPVAASIPAIIEYRKKYKTKSQ
jgi:predicted PurR-regulated permease PerM